MWQLLIQHVSKFMSKYTVCRKHCRKNPQGNDGKSSGHGKSHRHVTPIPFSGGMPGMGGERRGAVGVWKFERNGKWDFVSNVLHSQGPGKRGGGCSAWVCANIVSVPKRWVLGTTPLTGRSVGKSKPGCSLLLHQQRQRGDRSIEVSADLYEMYSE